MSSRKLCILARCWGRDGKIVSRRQNFQQESVCLQSVEILEVTEVTEVPVGTPELIGPPLVVIPSELDLADRDEAPVEDVEPSSPESDEYAEESEIFVVELDRTTFSAESAGPSSAEESTAEEWGEEADPRDRRIAELEREVRRLRELNLKLESERGGPGAGAGAGGGVRRIPVEGPENAGASSSGESHRLDTSKFGFRVLQPGEIRSGAMGNVGRGEDLNGRKTYVWYASFGSNLWEDRFMCYIKGGKVSGRRTNGQCLVALTTAVSLELTEAANEQSLQAWERGETKLFKPNSSTVKNKRQRF